MGRKEQMMSETDGGDSGTLPPIERAAPPAPARRGAVEREPTPAWLDSRLSDFGAPQAVIDGLIVRLGFQGMARLIADRPTLRVALLAEYRRQCAALRPRLLHEEWHV
jgi:hypothetical protein